MTKKQKIWFAIFLAMFVVPEVLWGYLNTFFCGSLFQGNGPEHFSLLIPVQSNTLNGLFIGIQFLGLLGCFILTLKFYKSKKIIFKFFLIILFGILLLLSFYLLLFALTFNPQFG